MDMKQDSNFKRQLPSAMQTCMLVMANSQNSANTGHRQASSIYGFQSYQRGSMKIVTWIFLCWLSQLSVNAQAAEEVLPPEVKNLVGMEVPFSESGMPMRIPDWDSMFEPEIDGPFIIEILQRGKNTVLITKSIDRTSKLTKILDARTISGDLLYYYLKDGKVQIRKKFKQLYTIASHCKRENSKDGGEIIIGMWRYGPGQACSDYSSQVMKAWLIDEESGKLTDIPAQGVSCRELFCGQD